MRFAFHFIADKHGGYYGPPIEELMFRALGRQIPAGRRHVRIRIGDLLILGDSPTPEKIEGAAFRILNPDRDVWSTIAADEFGVLARSETLYVVDVSGLTLRDAQNLDRDIRSNDPTGSYAGAIQIDLAVDIHWALYDQSLVNKYRIVGSELRMLHELKELEGDRDTWLQEHWKDIGIFDEVVFEDIGLQSTIFDPFQTRDHAIRHAELEEMLTAQYGVVVSETLLRIEDLDPNLRETLHAAFKAFDKAETSEHFAQVALSCRRFLEQLADVLFPAQDEDRDGRKLGKAQYRNRLWAYVGDQLDGSNQASVLASLVDVGSRIDQLDKLANRGLHASRITAADLQRLLVALTTLTYDLLTLAPQGTTPRLEPYNEQFLSSLVEMIPELDPRQGRKP